MDRRDSTELGHAIAEALDDLGEPGPPDRPIDAGWLRIGLRIGLGRPALAGRLLELTDPADGSAPAGDGEVLGSEWAGPGRAVLSSLLVRSATMPAAQRREAGPAVSFAWAARLREADVLGLGRVVARQLADGTTPDLGRAFGIAWDAGVRIPTKEREGLLDEFVDLEAAIGGALAGRELPATPPEPRSLGIVAAIDRWVRGAGPDPSPAVFAIRQGGEPARLGLVASWNAWAAVRYRGLVPGDLFGQLVHPWVTIVGPLPDDEPGA